MYLINWLPIYIYKSNVLYDYIIKFTHFKILYIAILKKWTINLKK